MKVVEITIHAGRTFNHPYEDYSNLRPSVTLRALLEEGEDYEKAVKDLQARAERMIEDHKNNMLSSLKELHTIEMYQDDVANLEDQIRRAQARLNEIRKENPQLRLEDNTGGEGE